MARDFPALEQRVNERRLVYLDTAATALKPRAVIEAVTQVYARDCANVHRGLHQLSQRASAAYEAARAALAGFLGARSQEEVVFVRGATEALNLVAASWAMPRLGQGDRILVTALEHHANLVPWQIVARRTGAILDVAPIEPSGEVSLDVLASRLTDRTRLVAVSHASNVLGTVLPIREIARMAHARGALLVVDGAQAAAHVRIDVKDLDCDFYALSGHKVYGPSGIGVLWARAELLAEMEPYQVGGDMVADVAFEGASYRAPPHRFEAGTPNIEGAIGLGAAVRYLRGLDAAAREAHERDLLEYAVSTLEEIPGVQIVGSPATRIPLLSFTVEDIHPHDLATFLDGEGIAVRAGHHCAQPLLEQLGHSALTRVSFGIYNTHADVDALAEALRGARDFFSVF
ncbi:SufS family cysteine desulfurase [Pendulispora brunnea]|uniref:Cysteine desulfurase n=1 Tax=Pendulispora brunnea TaxID=2905690 RepID=A0ABZ2KNM2_9BACT